MGSNHNMFRRVLLAAAAASLLAAGACAPITTYSGYQAIEADHDPSKDVKVGTDTKSTVRGKFGSPSATATFDPNVWYYMNQIKQRVAFKKPQVIARKVTAIKFDKETEVVKSVDNYTLKDGKIIAFNGRETPTRGREMTVLEQLVGSVGQGSMLPPQDEGLPGSRPGDRR